MPTFMATADGPLDMLAAVALSQYDSGGAELPAPEPSYLQELEDLPGFASVPPKLISRICKGEYIDI